MRTTRLLFTAALLVSPALASAQANCDASTGFTGPETNVNRPTCNVTRSATTTLTSILKLGLVSTASISLQATDTVAYEKTRTAAAGAGTSGTVVATPTALQSASARDSVIVQANRPYVLTISAQDSIFTFAKDGSYGVCRNSGTATTCLTTGEALTGKPIGDLYWKGGTQATFAQFVGGSAATPATVKTGTTGARYATGIDFKSAWFYGTDIPGVYSATIVYTVTGQ